MPKWEREVILVETTAYGKRVMVDPVEWINKEFDFNRHLDQFLQSILENVRSVRRREEPEAQA